MGPNAAGLKEIQIVINSIISSIVGLGVVVMFVMIVLAGTKYLRSGGDPKSIEAAKQTVTWAILGIVFMAVAWLILQLIFAVTGVEVTSFDIGILCRLTPGGDDFCK